MRTYKIRLLKCSGKDQKISAYLQLLTGLDKVMANRIVSNLPATLFDNLDEEGMEYIKTLSVTFAVRDTVLDGKEIHEGDFIGMSGSSIVSVENEVAKCTEDLIKSAVDDDAEVVTIYYGEDVSKNDAEKMKEYVESEFDHCEVELHYGGQPLYYYLISVE